MIYFRYPMEKYSKGSSKEYSVDIKHSQSMQLSQDITQEVIEQYFDGSPLNIIEIGGGHGSVMNKFHNDGHTTLNVTNNKEECEVIKGKGMNAVVTDMHYLDAEPIYDLLLISHVFEHSIAPYVLMTEFNEVLKHNGIVIIIVPNQEDKWVYEDYHYIVPTKDQLKNLAQKCGFKTLSCEYREHCNMEHLVYIGQKERYWQDE